jgi:hypothetical protein
MLAICRSNLLNIQRHLGVDMYRTFDDMEREMPWLNLGEFMPDPVRKAALIVADEMMQAVKAGIQSMDSRLPEAVRLEVTKQHRAHEAASELGARILDIMQPLGEGREWHRILSAQARAGGMPEA